MSNRWKGGFIQAYFDPLTEGPLVTELYSWGYGNYGQTGLNTSLNTSSPVQIGSDTGWDEISANVYVAGAIKDGALWVWGQNDYGNLGLNDSLIHRSSPTQVGSLTTWSKVGAGRYAFHAIKTDGTLWGMGEGQYGQVGNNNSSISVSSPVQITSDSDWSFIHEADGCAFAIKTDGSLYSWGYGLNGRTGHNDVISRSSPTQIGALTNWASVSGDRTIIAVKTDNTIWSWGDDFFGALGQNHSGPEISSPTQIGTLTNWASSAARIGASFAIKTDGTLWAWGRNYQGSLGLGNTISVSSPVQVGGDTNWQQASTGNYASFGIKTDGTLWSWGWSSNGGLGQNNGIELSSPVQVGSETYWQQIRGQYNSAIAIIGK